VRHRVVAQRDGAARLSRSAMTTVQQCLIEGNRVVGVSYVLYRVPTAQLLVVFALATITVVSEIKVAILRLSDMRTELHYDDYKCFMLAVARGFVILGFFEILCHWILIGNPFCGRMILILISNHVL